MSVEQFFEYARERYHIKLRREAGEIPPWTEDKVLQQFRFCNIHREDDKTTVWFRENVRDRVRDECIKAIFATVAFRMFNYIPTGERLLKMLVEYGWREVMARKALKNVDQLITGAYMVRTPYGKNKLEGICEMMKAFKTSDVWKHLPSCTRLSEAHALIEAVPYQGHFTAYEVVTDLRHTVVLEDALDIMEWANPGPGALRGCVWVSPGKYGTKAGRAKALDLMRQLLALANKGMWWPEEWPSWEMREVEHTLCEFDKYKRGQQGERLKRRYR
jgi:hypothetical protein